jgi:hypothetical protein
MAAASFKEIQFFRKTVIFYILIAVLLVAAFPICNGILQSHYPATTKVIYCFILPIMFLPIGFLYLVKLKVEIDDMGIHYKLSPIHRMTKSIFWDEIASIELRTYKPIREYGGWGWKRSFRHGRALTISGTKGLQIVLKNNRRLLLGVQDTEQLSLILQKNKPLQWQPIELMKQNK